MSIPSSLALNSSVQLEIAYQSIASFGRKFSMVSNLLFLQTTGTCNTIISKPYLRCCRSQLTSGSANSSLLKGQPKISHTVPSGDEVPNPFDISPTSGRRYTFETASYWPERKDYSRWKAVLGIVVLAHLSSCSQSFQGAYADKDTIAITRKFLFYRLSALVNLTLDG
jgi:hypothetical protein